MHTFLTGLASGGNHAHDCEIRRGLDPDDLNRADLKPTPGNYQIPAKARGWIQAEREMGLKTHLWAEAKRPRFD